LSCNNRLFVAYKPQFISSNHFLSKIKRRYRVKKAGFSGTLDPFAKGALIIAFGQYTKLFRFLKKAPKRYKAVLWLGAKSKTLDIESVESIEETKSFKKSEICKVLDSLKGIVSYEAPKYSAKKIDGNRAYELARNEIEFEAPKIESEIYDIKFINYSHPFLTFEIEIEEGGYIRSIAKIIAKKLGCNGTLSYLERLKEGDFFYSHESALEVVKYLDMPQNRYLKDNFDIIQGKKVRVEDFEICTSGRYYLTIDRFLTIIEIEKSRVNYLCNRIEIC